MANEWKKSAKKYYYNIYGLDVLVFCLGELCDIWEYCILSDSSMT